MPKRKELPLEEQTDAQIRQHIAMGKRRIAILKQEQYDIEADIRTWERELKDREGICSPAKR